MADVMLPIASLRRDGGTQPRAMLNPETVADYAEARRNGATFPKIGVVYDGTDHWIWDGFHRTAGCEEAGDAEIAADVRPGTRRDAVLLACGANATHGLRRSNEDKRRAVLLLLDDPEWSAWSDREIARRCAVSHDFVSRLRASLSSDDSEPSRRLFTTRHGTVAKMDTAAIGKRAADVATIRSLPVEALYEAADEHFRQRHRLKQDAKKARREEREQDLGQRIAAENAKLEGWVAAKRQFVVLLADPAWRPEPYSRETGLDRAPDNHYPTMKTSEIAALPIGEIGAPDSVLFLWATMQMLPDAFVVIDAWGYTYKSHCVWVKRRPGNKRGPGYWFTGEHEILIVATRGNPPCPAQGLQWPSVIIAPIGRHSEKPDRIYELIETYFPTGPKAEFNARCRRDGWEVWGCEAPELLPDAGATPRLGRPIADEIDAYAEGMAGADLDRHAAAVGRAAVASIARGERPAIATELAALRRKRRS